MDSTQTGSTGQVTAAPDPRRHGLRQIAAVCAGNAVEWYDWYTYTFLAVYFAGQIFPGHDEVAKLLGSFAVFAVGFFMRPLGGLLLGAVADRYGRRSAFTVTILLIGLGSLLVGVTPSYAAAGLFAPSMLLLARLISGLSVGGEFAASSTFLVESAPPHRRGLYASFHYVSNALGQLAAAGLAALLANTLSKPEMTTWGWRLPFLLGAALALVGLWIRRGAIETHTVPTARPRLFEAILRHPGQSLLICGVTVGGTITYYTWSVYLPTYVHQRVGLDPGTALAISTIAIAFLAVLQPLGGLLSDRIGRRPLLITFAAGFTLLVVPLLALLRDSFWPVLLISCLGMVILTGYTSIACAINAEIFPTRVRAAGIGFPYSLTVALFGGTAPYLGTLFRYLGHPGLFPWYVAVLCLLSLVVYLRLPETAHRPLP